MEEKPLRAGFIGLNPDSHWAATAHIPALASLGDKFKVVGVANRSEESARRTVETMNLPPATAPPYTAAARNVAGVYARLYQDITQGSRTAPSFDDAVAVHELMDAIERSAR
ncbi:hypothetical protein ASALC70_01849 [Alcanivorax sp. ALC70]|nr:hypothetical protein ASALC70_01849 [Alcanivorax sp. ALC70]